MYFYKYLLLNIRLILLRIGFIADLVERERERERALRQAQ